MQAVGTVSLVSAILFLPYLAAVYIYMMPVSLGHRLCPCSACASQSTGLDHLTACMHAVTVMSLVTVSCACNVGHEEHIGPGVWLGAAYPDLQTCGLWHLCGQRQTLCESGSIPSIHKRQIRSCW